jgi:hypothetical protein
MTRPVLLCAVAILMSACSADAPVGPGDPGPDPVSGLLAFERECASCHASKDGFDLAVFGFMDSTIIRRAVGHVDTATALDIVAHIRRLNTPHVSENTRLFQPGNVPIASDMEFTVALFGRDAWPAEMTTAMLRTIDPRQVRIAVPLPVWSDETGNLDWMPDVPLPDHVLQYSGAAATAMLAGYRAAPSRENLLRAVTTLRAIDRTPANPDAPCLFEDPTRVRYVECFEIRRWASSLVGQHMLRYDLEQNLGADIHDIWWDVGNAARKSRQDPSQTVAAATVNWASWMFLGWSFDPSRHPSVYTGGGFQNLGLPRHATFVALRSEVARPVNSPMVYDDLRQAARFSPPHWTASATTFALRHLIERLDAGDRPTRPEQRTEAMTVVNAALVDALRKVPVADRAAISVLGQQVLAKLQ